MRGKATTVTLDVLRHMAAAVFFLVLAGCAAPPSAADSAKIDRVLLLIGERLSYMDDVARNKWNSGAPIEDLPREREIIDGLGRQAADYGLDAGTARDFFRAQPKRRRSSSARALRSGARKTSRRSRTRATCATR